MRKNSLVEGEELELNQRVIIGQKGANWIYHAVVPLKFWLTYRGQKCLN